MYADRSNKNNVFELVTSNIATGLKWFLFIDENITQQARMRRKSRIPVSLEFLGQLHSEDHNATIFVFYEMLKNYSVLFNSTFIIK